VRKGVKPLVALGVDTIVGVLKFLAYTRDGPAFARFGLIKEGTAAAPCRPMTRVAALNLTLARDVSHGLTLPK
jgi:hypothetical protein